MRQYTTPEQTVKLVELGLPKPNGLEFLVREKDNPDNAKIVQRMAYSIGELLSFLPENIAKEDEMPSTLNISLLDGEWCVEYADFLGADFSFRSVELIDAIFNMIEKLKEEGVI